MRSATRETAPNWFADAGSLVNDATGGSGGLVPITRGFTRPIAENIIALIIAPRVSDVQAASAGLEPHYITGPNYTYDSTKTGAMGTTIANPQGTQNLLPPLVDVVMVALDEASSPNFLPSDMSAFSSLFVTPSNMTADIQTMQGLLVNRTGTQKPVNFRIYKATVEIRSARWSL
jgi:uncharacterized protein (TIGR02599 family)